MLVKRAANLMLGNDAANLMLGKRAVNLMFLAKHLIKREVELKT
jgi:hypothetical protein